MFEKVDGGTVVIIGTAPSLTVEDMLTVQRLPTFGCGHLLLWPSLPYIPTYFGVSEESAFVNLRSVAEHSGARLVAALPEPREHFPSHDHPERERYQRRWDYLQPSDAWWSLDLSFKETLERDDFSPELVDDGRVIMCWSCSAFISPLQTAVWMGYERIVLLGIDMTYTGYLDGLHDARGEKRDVALRRECHQSAVCGRVRTCCEAAGVSIVNCSPGYTDMGIAKSTLKDEFRLSLTLDQCFRANHSAIAGGEYVISDPAGGIDLHVDSNDYKCVLWATPKTGTNILAWEAEDTITPGMSRTPLLEKITRKLEAR